MAGAAARVRSGLAAVRRGVRAVTGEDAYEVYLAHRRAVHAGGEPMTAREFWRDRTDRLDRDPGGRCC